jgi:hypothetical protein
MSRVFDALQEAARHRGPNGAPAEAVWTELGINPATVPVPKVEKDITPIRASESTAAVAAEEILDALEVTPEVEDVPSASSADQTSAKILLDKRARLIPHTTDQIVVERYRMLRTKILQEREKKFCEWLGIDKDQVGLSNLIEGSARLDQVLLKSEELSFHIIPRGNAQICDLQTSQFDEYFRQVSEQYDLVLVDTPPVNLITDVQIMAASCDAVLLIARAFSTTSKSLEEAVDKLQSFRVIGSVLNAGTPRKSRKYQGYY